MRFALLLTLAILAFNAPAFAQIVQCGAPADADLETDPGFEYCDIYARQSAYRENNKTYRAKIDERRANYNAPRASVLQGNATQTVSADISSEEKKDSTVEADGADLFGTDASDPNAPINLLDGVQ